MPERIDVNDGISFEQLLKVVGPAKKGRSFESKFKKVFVLSKPGEVKKAKQEGLFK